MGKPKRPPLTGVGIAELSSGASPEQPDGLYTADYLPAMWTPGAASDRWRRLVARRYQVVRHRTRLNNAMHAILHAHLIPRCAHADLFNRRGRDWPACPLGEVIEPGSNTRSPPPSTRSC